MWVYCLLVRFPNNNEKFFGMFTWSGLQEFMNKHNYVYKMGIIYNQSGEEKFLAYSNYLKEENFDG